MIPARGSKFSFQILARAVSMFRISGWIDRTLLQTHRSNHCQNEDPTDFYTSIWPSLFSKASRFLREFRLQFSLIGSCTLKNLHTMLQHFCCPQNYKWHERADRVDHTHNVKIGQKSLKNSIQNGKSEQYCFNLLGYHLIGGLSNSKVLNLES